MTDPADPDPEPDRLTIPLEPETALRALLAVDPQSEPVDEQGEQPEPSERNSDDA